MQIDAESETFVSSTLNGSGAGGSRPAGNANELGFCVSVPLRRGAETDSDRMGEAARNA